MNRPFAKTFEDLEVYKMAFDTSLDIHKASLNFPKIEQYALGDQIRRASKSICANIAEGFAKQKTSTVDYRRFLMMALGSCNEMLVWIKYCVRLGYVEQTQADQWRDAYQAIGRMLNKLHSYRPHHEAA